MPYSEDVELLRRVYHWSNLRDMEAVLATMHNDVIWANGMEGGHLHGRDGVRDYWTRQWTLVDPRVEPLNFGGGPDGEVVVEVHQTVRDLEGHVLVDQTMRHIFRLEHGMIRRFDIREYPS